MNHPFTKEELPTTLFGIFVMLTMVGGAIYLDFESLSTLIQTGFFLGFGMGTFLVAPKRIREYFSIIPKIREKLGRDNE